jgi:hypothetical protein
LLEIRNQIYEYTLSNIGTQPVSLIAAQPLSSTCRQVRAEYLSLFPKNIEVTVSFHKFNCFLETFCIPDATAIAKDHKVTCRLLVTIWPNHEPIIDILWLLRLLRKNPGVEIKFAAYWGFSIGNLTKLLEIARSNSPAREGRDNDFESIKLNLHVPPSYQQASSGYGRDSIEMEICLKNSATLGLWDMRFEQRRKHISLLVVSLGLSRKYGFHSMCNGIGTYSNFNQMKVRATKSDSTLYDVQTGNEDSGGYW